MPLVPKSVYKARLARDARCSNHAIMLLDDYDFFETSKGWIFPVRFSGGTAIVAVDPLRRSSPPESSTLESEFSFAFEEFEQFVGRRRMAFVGVSHAFALLLKSRGFTVLKAGEEPWIALASYEPRGDAGKGVRAARNKALRAGCKVEEWSFASVVESGERQDIVREVFADWSGSTLLHFEGLFLAVDPFADIPGRRFFVVTAPLRPDVGSVPPNPLSSIQTVDSESRVEAVLVATPIHEGQTYYFEDTVYRSDAPDGVVELVMLGAMKALESSGVREVSLGVVPFRNVDEESLEDGGLDDLGLERTQRVLSHAKDLVSTLYNVDGIALSRKRFRPQRWEWVCLCYRARSRHGAGAARSRPNAFVTLRSQLGKGLWKATSGDMRVLGGVIVDLFRALKPTFAPVSVLSKSWTKKGARGGEAKAG